MAAILQKTYTKYIFFMEKFEFWLKFIEICFYESWQ